MKLTALLILAALPFLEASSPAEAGLVVRAEGKVATPNVDTTTPKVGTAKPKGDTTKSKVDTTTPQVDTTKPKEDTTKPKAGTTDTSKYNALRPNVGCIPETCGSACKREFEPRFAAIAALKKRANAPTTPALKTTDGLDDWTKEVYKSPNMPLDIGSERRPKSIFSTWEKLGDMKFVTMYGLYGCGSVVVVSDKGFYMSHHWDNTISDAGLQQAPKMFENAFTAALKGEPSVTDAADPSVADFYPKDGWTPLTAKGPKDAFAEENNPKAAVIIHDGLDADDGPMPVQFGKTGPDMKSLVGKLVPGSNPELVKYANAKSNIQQAANKPPSQSGSQGQQPGKQQTGKQQTGKQQTGKQQGQGQGQGQGSDSQGSTTSSSVASTASVNKADRHGKVIISYDKATKIYQVWMAGADVTKPILTNAKPE